MEDSVGCGDRGRLAGHGGSLGPARPSSAQVVPAAPHHLADVITAPLSDVINPSSDVTLPRPRVTLPAGATLIAKGNCSPAATNLLHEVLSTTITTTPITAITIAAAGVTTTTTATTSTPTTTTATTTPATTTITTTTTTASLPGFKTTPIFHIEPEWREAAQEPVLLVRCKKTVAELHKSRFGSGSRGKCIKLGKEWYTPTEFEVHCGRSASKDWKRSIRFQGQSLLTLIEDGFLQMHATSCSCGACLHNEEAAGSIRLHRPFKRKKRDRLFLNTEKALKHAIPANQSSTTPTVTLPVSGLGELTVVPGLVLGGGTHSPPGTLTTTPTAASSTTSPAVSFTNLPLDKVWERMSEILVGLQRSVSQAHVLLDELRDRTRQETLTLRQKLLQEKEEAVTQTKIEAQLSNMAKSSEGFLVQVREDDGNQSLQPIMLDSLISSVPALNPAPPINGVQKKCVNCNRESDFECSGCQNRPYCSSFCQRRDWPSHQGECGRSSPTEEDPLNVPQTPGYIFMLSD